MKLDPIRIIIWKLTKLGIVASMVLPDEGVDLGDVDIIQLLDGGLDLVLVGLDVADEDEGVVVLDLLHRRLGRQGVLDDVVSVHPARNK